MKKLLVKSMTIFVSAMILSGCVSTSSQDTNVGFNEVESEQSQIILKEFKAMLLDSKNKFLDGEFSEYSTATNLETSETEKVKKLYSSQYPFEQITFFEKDNTSYKSNDTQNLYLMLIEDVIDRDLDNTIPARVQKEINEDGSVNYIFQIKDDALGDTQTWQITSKDNIAISGLYKRLTIKIEYTFNYKLTGEEKLLWN